MANLFFKTKTHTKSLLELPFKTEEEFEKFLFESKGILDEIYLLKRQVRGGNKPGIPDIVGLDNDGNVCIIEMKKSTVDASVIPQVLQYAIWAETNPDSIKNLWLETEDKPDDLEVNWTDFQVRIVVVAPKILLSTLDVVTRINYTVDLIEISRWVDQDTDNQILLVRKLENDEKKFKAKPVSGLQTYDEEFYKREYNKESAVHFLRYVKEVEGVIRQKGWKLETKFNKHYCGFKSGFPLVFGIKWLGSRSFAFFFKISESEAASLDVPLTKYDAQWKEAVYYIDPTKTKTNEFKKHFEAAYKRILGE